MNKFLVIVHPATPDNVGKDVGSYTVAKPPQVKWVTARSPQLAADQVRVDPGGHVLVVSEADVVRFDRAKEAPLVEKRPDGNPLDQVAEAIHA